MRARSLPNVRLVPHLTRRPPPAPDPASEADYTVGEGLMFPGTGLHACPREDAAVERLVTIAPMEDRMNVCTEVQHAPRARAVAGRAAAAPTKPSAACLVAARGAAGSKHTHNAPPRPPNSSR